MSGASVRVLGIAGSLRKGSYNAAALRTAKELAPIRHGDRNFRYLADPALQ